MLVLLYELLLMSLLVRLLSLLELLLLDELGFDIFQDIAPRDLNSFWILFRRCLFLEATSRFVDMAAVKGEKFSNRLRSFIVPSFLPLSVLDVFSAFRVFNLLAAARVFVTTVEAILGWMRAKASLMIIPSAFRKL